MTRGIKIIQNRQLKIKTNDWTPELHPRDGEGKFTETGGGLPDLIDAFESFGTKEDRQNVSGTFNEWAAWPLGEDTTPAWDAAREETNNDNLPDGPGIGSFLGDPQPDVQESLEKHSDWLTEQLREEHGDTVTAHRILHGEAAEDLRNGRSLTPRTLASWTTDDSTLDEVVAQTGADMDENLENSVVVTKEIPVENVFGVHTANENLAAREQDELIAALSRGNDLSDGEIREATGVLENGD